MEIVVIYVIVLVASCVRCGSCENLTKCSDNCVSKIADEQLCNKTCLQLLNTSSASNITTLPPVPDGPVLLSSAYFTFTLDWSSYSETKYSASPVVYVLEVTRHENITDSFIILPYIQKYHATTNTTFTIPEQFVTKTNFSFRLAVVALQGTSNFSSPSPLYTTNSSCDRVQHYYNNSRLYPCPVFNVRTKFTVTPVQFKTPTISTIISWDFPHDLHDNLEYGEIYLYAELSDKVSPDRKNPCVALGLQYQDEYTTPRRPATSEAVTLPQNSQFYFGCLYDIKLYSPYNEEYSTLATFYIPHCIHGYCGCDHGTTAVREDKEHINVDVRGSEHSVNMTTAHVTWSILAWNKKPAFFKLIILNCNPRCPSFSGKRREVILADGMKSSYNFTFHNLTKGVEHRVILAAFDRSGCQLSPTKGKRFDAIIPTTIPSTIPSTIPTTIPTTIPKTIPKTIPRTVSASTERTVGRPVTTTAKQGLSSATVAAITVPIFLLLVIGLLLVSFWYFRTHRKPSRLHRAPTGLQRLADHLDDRNNYIRNLQDDPSSPYANDYDRFNLAVNLPSKSEGGLELNPAYVEQRIQEAVEIGEADEFEFGFHRLELKRVLGKGAFGKVFLAEAYGMGGTQDTSLVAVKVLNEKANDDEIEDFKMEINFMKTIGHHDNVLTMLGCCTLYPPLCLVIEYVPHGDLLHYLRDLRKTFEQQYRKLQGEDIKSLITDEKSSSSQSRTDGSESLGPGSYSHRPLVPSASDSKKYEKFLEHNETVKTNRSHSSGSVKGLKALSALNTRRKSSESPQVHYVARVPTDASNNTETTLVLDSKAAYKAQAASLTRALSLDGALDSTDLQSFAFQIANGMAYLSAKGVVHRDLAARNILVGDEKVLKISDFGLSREGVYVKRSTGKIPLRWLSTEAMRDRIYSTASDVWAFGIILWEICTLGGFPYPTSNDRDLLDFLTEGNRMEKPNNCTDEIYQIMLACWSRECEDRPSFQTLSEQLFDMQKEEQPYVNVDPTQDFTLPPTAGQDTVGNLIAFSDGTFSGETADHELAQMEALPNQLSLTPGNTSLQNEQLPLSIDEENDGYESSNDSEDLSNSSNDVAGNEIPSTPTEQPVIDIEDIWDSETMV